MKTNKTDRFKLEELITDMDKVRDDLELLLYKTLDSPKPCSEDELGNTIIGMIELHRTRYEKLWIYFEEMVKEGTV